MKEKLAYSYYVFVAILATYIVLVLSLPVNKLVLKHYDISVTGLRFLELTYVLPLAAIWALAYYGYSKIHKYSLTIGKNKEGKQLNRIALGIGVLAFGSPINNIISSTLNSIGQAHIHLIPTFTIINNYLSVGVALASLILIGAGARGLADITKARLSYRSIQIFSLIFIVVASVFCYLVFHKLPNSLSLGIVSKPNYYLPNWLLLFTLVIPYMFAWYTGGLAVLNVSAYNQKVKGLLYKASMLYVGIGIPLIIFSIILLQYLSFVAAKLATLKIVALLLIAYPLLIIISLGYICVAIGAKKLQKIEET
jgi:hypothetical protein